MKYVKFVLMLLLFPVILFSQERFFSLYPGLGLNKSYSIDGNYVLCGVDTVENTGRITPLFNIIDYNGNILDTYEYVSDSIYGFSIYASNSYSTNVDYILASGVYKEFTKSYTLNPILMYFNRVNYNMDSIIDLKEYFVNDITSTAMFHIEYENEIHLFGSSQYTLEHDSKTFFGKYNKSTSEFALTHYNKPNNCKMKPYAALPTTDGGYIISTEQDEEYFYPHEFHACLLKIDSEGNEQWRYVIPGQEYYHDIFGNVEAATYRPRVFNAPDGNYWVVWTDPFIITDMLLQDNAYRSIRIAKLMDYGNTFNFTDERSLMVELDNPENFRSFMINDSYQDENGDMYILLQHYGGYNSALAKIHKNGVGAWLKTYRCYPENTADISDTKLVGITKTPDNGFMLCGDYYSSSGNVFPSGIQSAIVIKTDSCGCFDAAGCNDHCMDTYSDYYIFMEEVSIFPNPASDKITVSFDYQGSSDTEFEYRVYTVEGKIIQSGTFRGLREPQSPQCPLSVQALQSGIYTIQVWGGGKIYTGKFVKE